ncbi:hypothetical protein AAAC13_01390 [Pseudomonas aeruginosa]
MRSLSVLVLVWLFGTWSFSDLPDGVASTATAVTPVIIFASYFTTFGLMLIGMLISWAIFLGIFRLRANGNFFGSRDKNEAFFIPCGWSSACCCVPPSSQWQPLPANQ